LETLARIYFTYPKSEANVFIPHTEGNLQYFFIQTKKYDTINNLKKYVVQTLKNFEDKKLTKEGQVTKRFLKTTLELLTTFKDIEECRAAYSQLISIATEARLMYHEELWNNPYHSLEALLNLVVKRLHND